jgi:hypothetical protein
LRWLLYIYSLSVTFRKYATVLWYNQVNLFVLHYQLQFKSCLQPPKICRYKFLPVKWTISQEHQKIMIQPASVHDIANGGRVNRTISNVLRINYDTVGHQHISRVETQRKLISLSNISNNYNQDNPPEHGVSEMLLID